MKFHFHIKKRKPEQYIFFSLGVLFAGLGAVGGILPVLPSVPFLLLASFFLTKGSRKFQEWLESTNFYKKHLEEISKEQSMPVRSKIFVLFYVTFMLGFSFWMVSSVWLKGFVVLVIIFEYYYFCFFIKTKRRH